MAVLAREPDATPLLEINTTPLIDVMLVLIIMLIITMPMQEHSVRLDLPSPGPGPEVRVDPVRNKVVVRTDGSLLWNGEPVSLSGLERLFEQAAAAPSQPEVHLQPEALAPYGRVDEVLVAAKRADVTALGFVGNEAYWRF